MCSIPLIYAHIPLHTCLDFQFGGIIDPTVFYYVTGDPIEVSFERSIYTVDENVGDNNLALLVCVNASNATTEFTVTLSTENGTAIGI